MGALEQTLTIASSLLENDIDMCFSEQKQLNTQESTKEFMSTIHVTIPHHDRGNRNGSSWQRNLTNCVVELLLWNRISKIKSQDRFSKSLKNLQGCSATIDEAINLFFKYRPAYENIVLY